MPLQPAILGTARLGNFRLGYAPAALTALRQTHVRILLAGVDAQTLTAPTRVRVGSVTIRDLLNDAPNTCSLTFRGTAPTVGQSLRVLLNSDTPQLLFSGELQNVSQSYLGRPAEVTYPCTAIDDTARANRRRPFGVWTNVSATTVVQALISSYAPGFSSAGVEAGLPAVTVNFDGTEGIKGCLAHIARQIGAYWLFEDLTLYFFLTYTGAVPDDLDATPQRFLDDPPITWTIDKSQARTKVYGKGAGSAIVNDIEAGAAIVPVALAVMFNPLGGQAIAGVTPDGGQSEILDYTGVQLGSGGGLVGPGAGPSSAPTVALAAGSGVESGVHDYGVTFVTASGESAVSPLASITVGLVAAPTTAPTPGTPTVGSGSVDAGSHDYAVTVVTAAGETTLSPISGQVTPGGLASISAPTSGMVASAGSSNPTGYQVGGDYAFCVTFVTATGETMASPTVPFVVSSFARDCNLSSIPLGPVGTTARNIYTITGGTSFYKHQIPNNTATTYTSQHDEPLVSGPPSVGTATAPTGTIPLTAIPIGSALTTQRKLYRRFNGTGTFKLAATIANNTATTHSDTVANSSLGADAPSTNTATANQVAITNVPIGAAAVTQRKIYRTAAGGAQLKLQQTIADNTTTTGVTDATADASLGANAPTGDTSGLPQPEGQVLAGGTELIIANAAAFSSTGGWAVLGNGTQIIRYTGTTGNSLTGIPASGVGAITATVSYNSMITASPALTGVTGVIRTLLKGSAIHVWVERNDLAAQTYMAALDGHGDGVYEHVLSDERRTEASLAQLCDAELVLFSRPLVTVRYASRDPKTKSGRPIVVNLASPAISETLTIQEVTIDQLGTAPGTRPRFTVTASSVRQSLNAILRDLIRKAA